MADVVKPSKHGRDHCPGGEDPIPCFNTPWVVLVNSGQTLAGDNVVHDAVFTEAYWDATITPDPTAGGPNPFFIQSVSDGEGNDIWQLTCNREGWFDFEVVHALDEATSNGGANIFFMQEMTHTGGAVFTNDNPFGGSMPWTVSGPELAITPYIQTFWRPWLNSSSVITVNLRQNSGADKSVNGHMKVWYRAGFGGATSNTAWEFASSF